MDTPVDMARLRDGGAKYHFVLSSRYAPGTRFQFGYTGYDQAPEMPVGDFYWFVLSDFDPERAQHAKNEKR